MYKLRVAKKVLTFLTCSVMSMGLIALYPMSTDNNNAEAKTIAEIQEQRKANQAKIEELELQISGLEGDKNSEQQQQNYLNEQIGYIQENITFLNAELESIGKDIETTETNIQNLDIDIENQQKSIDENIEKFKQRLCLMYMNRNESAASVMLGTSSFYDMMSRVQMINSIAEYDDKLIDEILTEIQTMEQSKKDLEVEKNNLQLKLEEQEKRKEDKKSELALYDEKMQKSQTEIERLAMEQASLELDKETIEKQDAELEQEEANIWAEIQRKAEEAQRRWEEEQRKKKEAEEAERKRQEELKKQQEEAERKRQEELKKQQEEEAEKKRQEELKNQQTTSANAVQTSANTTVTVAVTTVAETTQAPVTTTEPYIPTVSESGFAWPAPGFSYISSYFGYRWGTTHKGIDIGDAGIMGGSAVASQSGIVITVNNSCTHNYAKSSSCGCGGGYGNYVVISHDGTYSTLYGHLTSAAVSVGDYVNQGDVIGYIGCTGFSTGAHLHFEVWENGVKQNPLNYVSQ